MTDTACFTPVAGVRHADALPPGTRLAEFEVVSLLGVGGFGMVYKAFDHSLHRTVAIKEYMPAALAGRSDGCSVGVRAPSDEPAFQSGLQSFVAEARMLAQFDHPSLVKVFRFWEAHHTAYMVMPLYSGMTFKQARAQMRTPPPQAWLEQVLWSMLAALRTLHDGHTLHRDISPDNIFLQDVGPPILLDLGAARHAIHDRDHPHTAILKVNYAPIEQYDAAEGGLQAGPWSDLYSLAAVVHGCLCNDTPLPSTLRAIRDRMVPFARVAKTVKSQFGQAYSHAFVAAISQALALQPQDRPQDIDAFLRTMGLLSAPAGLEYFDFRTELGDIWVEPTDQLGPGVLLPTVDLLHAQASQLGVSARVVPQARVVSMPSAAAPMVQHTTIVPRVRSADGAAENAEGQDTILMDAGDTVMLDDLVDLSNLEPGDALLQKPALERPAVMGESEALPASAQSASPKPALAWRKIGAAGAAVLLVVALVWGWIWPPGAAPRVAQDDIITELAEPQAVTATEAPTALQAPPDVDAPEPPAALLQPAPAFVEVTPAQMAARTAVRRAPKNTAAAPEPDGAAATSAVPAPAAAVPAPPPKPQSQPQRQQPPLCTDTNFFTRSACIYEECAKPAFAALPVCVEHRRKLQQQLDQQKMGN